ncbi:hypothetical protein SAMN04488128_104424 [Chitinophaga eiseniae]|uniref:Uncharacterized protein n=1 Tax=Chitinophaga eiseniae TaxID=634771 RepID=A0A1T4TD10_9BACT|nr:hypothetical protein SAMN04488128_104424 [Chitinophaga eiseniae]
MRVLCFHPDETSIPYSHYVESLRSYPFTTVVVHNHQQLKRTILTGQYEIALLPWNSRSWLQTVKTRRISLLLRKSSPTCFVLLYRCSPEPISKLLAAIMPLSGNVSFGNTLEPGAFPALVEKLFLRWLQQLTRKKVVGQLKKLNSIKGMVAVDYLAGELIKQSLSEIGIHIKLTEVSMDFESRFLQEFPDFVLLHCHNRNGDSDIVITATHTIRRMHPRCIIYITCSAVTWSQFPQRYRLHEFAFDELLLIPYTQEELRRMLFRDLVLRRYHLPPTHS